jgi:uncharacterized protein
MKPIQRRENMRNPFYYGNEVSGDDFCDREQELRELTGDVRSGLNVLLYAPRRIGKTSLLRKLQRELVQSDEYVAVFFDFFSVSSVDEFIQGYFNAVAKSFDTVPERVMNLLKSVLKVRPNIQVTVGQSGELMYGMSFSRKERTASLEDVLNLPHVFAQAKKRRVVVIFDEFQEIEQFDLEKKFRSIVQTHGRDVCYLFSGSKKSILHRMFHDSSRAFYRSVKHLRIGEISLDQWSGFIQAKFSRTGKEIAPDLIRQAFTITRGFPYYMQQLMFEVWDRTDALVDESIIQDAVRLMCEREYDLYSLVWSDLTPNQKKTLKYIVRSDGRNLYANDQLGETGLTASTLKSTLDGLMKKDVCERTDDQYLLVDPLMRHWVERYMV